MKITFNINYHTNWGESVYLYGASPLLGNGDARQAVEMSLISPDMWQFTLDVPETPLAFDYFFVVKADNRAWRFEWGEPHKFVPGAGISDYVIYDSWHEQPADKPFYSSAFLNGILRRSHRDEPLPMMPGTVNIRIEAAMINPDETLAICGEGDYLGNWDPRHAIKLNDAHFPVWEVNLDLSKLKIPFEYKFIILDKEGETVGWEAMNNRVYGIVPTGRNQQIIIDGTRFANPKQQWRGAGTAIPVFSIRSEEDFGAGDFYDIMKMADWCKSTGQNILQILPINDTTMTGTWLDSYPYKANSIFALHPMYLRMEAVGTLKDEARLEYYEKLRQELNMLTTVDYERVNNAKLEYLHELYAQDFGSTQRRKDYKEFVAANDHWLFSYSAWCVLRDLNHTADHSKWGEYSVFNHDKVAGFMNEHRKEADFYYFMQYHLDRQLRHVRNYAHSQGVILKGDIPIGVSRHSVDTWIDPRLFNMDCQAGAPPDDFSVLGQNWGFPTYNWDVMAEDGFKWWKNRFAKMAEYFDAYRIDHILGFFRIWQIPLTATHGLLGYFNPAMPYSADELRNSYDFWINPEVQTYPLILEWMLTDFFGEYTNEAKDLFLDRIGGDRYGLKSIVDTQVKVEEYFKGKEENEKNNRFKNALLGLLDDVLFIEDPYQKGHYHPRISAQYTYQYRVLSDYEKWCFNRLYNDFFYHRHNDFWYGKAMWKLPPLLDSTSMLACGEDLGMIPDCVPAVMHQLEILSLEIQRMPKDPKAEFGDTWHYPYYSVCTTSTHDMDGIRAWWESDHAVAQRFYNNVLHEAGEAPYFAEPWICDKIIDLQLKSPSMLCILPLQDWLSTDGSIRRQNPAEELINVPANPRHYWRYRMHLTVEELQSKTSFNAMVKTKIEESNR
ncbi:MAG: 4-alpha-glucanotransferase [Candidatus Amulumruptor caecigallinarius]|nr:4-alpha-glucanotransferase [Candidatus Amulumruptor caecigallinarius]